VKKINTLLELKEERKRLLLKQAELELAIKTDFHEIKEELEPGHIIARATSKLIMSKDEGVLGYAIGTLTNLVVNKIIFRKSGFIKKFVASYIGRNIATNAFSKNKETIFNWITSLFQKARDKNRSTSHPEKIYDKGEFIEF
jgi:hypothetical protein